MVVDPEFSVLNQICEAELAVEPRLEIAEGVIDRLARTIINNDAGASPSA